MTAVFGKEYAGRYDALYRDKNYSEECEQIGRLLKTYSDRPVRSILDLGCGTGNHALLLAQQGYDIIGIDRSSTMLERARKKTADHQLNGKAVFHEGDIRNVQEDRSFDAVLMMFAVLGYQLENHDVLAVLRSARRHLPSGGLLIFDVWYGPAVLREGPSDRMKSIATHDGQILRFASGRLDVQRHVCEVAYQLWDLAGDRVRSKTEEIHRMRYFFPLELRLFLECCDFSLERLGAFPEFDREPDAATWNVLGVARAI